MANNLYEWCIENDKKYLIDEWDTERNEKMGIDVKNVMAGSNIDVNWKCELGHIWITGICNRTRKNGTNCPYCSGHKVWPGYNDFQTKNAEAMKYWDWDKNAVKPDTISYGSGKAIWWKCQQGHSFQKAAINMKNNQICPICDPPKNKGKPTTKRNKPKKHNLKDWAIENNMEYLMDEWDTERNLKELNLKITDGTYGKKIKVYWKCSKGHEWMAYIYSRTGGRKHNCPVCESQRVHKGHNDFETWCKKNNKMYLLDEWDYVKNKIKPTEVAHASHKRIHWICSNDNRHKWVTALQGRIGNTSLDCPYCSNRKVLPGYNDLATTNPELVKEWHPTKNGELTPRDIVAGSTKKYWWRCLKGHEWETRAAHRTVSNSKCPHCSTNGTSFPEQYLYYALKSKFRSITNRTKINGYEYDIHIEDINLLIEYDGIYWHRILSDKTDREHEKTNIARDNGFDFIRVKESKSKKDPNIKNKIIRIYERPKIEDLNAVIDLIIQYVNNTYRLNIDTSIPDDLKQIVRNKMKNF